MITKRIQKEKMAIESDVTCFASSPILVYEVSSNNSDFGK